MEWQELSTTVKAVGAVAGAIAAIVGLLFLFFPDLRPDPTPDEGSATFSEASLEQPVTYGQYLDRVEIPRDTYTEEELRRPGALVSVEVTIKGYRGMALPLRWYLLDGAEIVEQQSRRHTLTADRNEAPAAWSFWVPSSARGRAVQGRDGDLPAEPEDRHGPPRRRGDGAVHARRLALAERAQLEGQHEQAHELAADEVERPRTVG